MLRLQEVIHMIGLSRQTIYRRMEAGTFPKQLDLGGDTVRWRLSDVRAWMGALPVR